MQNSKAIVISIWSNRYVGRYVGTEKTKMSIDKQNQYMFGGIKQQTAVTVKARELNGGHNLFNLFDARNHQLNLN